MKIIALKYSNSNVDFHGDSFNESASEQMIFNAMAYYRPKPNIERESGRLLSNRAYHHILKSWKVHAIVLSADTITDEATEDFLEECWKAGRLFLAVKETTWSNYIEVYPGSGIIPRDYIEEYPDLPEYTFEFESMR